MQRRGSGAAGAERVRRGHHAGPPRRGGMERGGRELRGLARVPVRVLPRQPACRTRGETAVRLGDLCDGFLLRDVWCVSLGSRNESWFLRDRCGPCSAFLGCAKLDWE